MAVFESLARRKDVGLPPELRWLSVVFSTACRNPAWRTENGRRLSTLLYIAFAGNLLQLLARMK